VTRIAFRADASIEIGSGHVMRCLSLADELRELGAETLFLCRSLPGHLGEQITARGHAVSWLDTDAAHVPDDVACQAHMSDHAPWDWLVVDHYALAAEWETAMRAVARRIMAIDDLADRSHDCDLLMDQNLQCPGRYDGLLPDHCEQLLGPRYALLRPQFAKTRESQVARMGKFDRLMVFFGGADAGGATLTALAALKKWGRSDVAVDVVVGQTNPHHAAIAVACDALPGATLHCGVHDMASMMASADLLLGAGGGSAWERCCLGLPAVILAAADNQVDQAIALARVGSQLYLGKSSAVDVDRMVAVLDTLHGLPDLLCHMANQAVNLVDGQGVRRVANHLIDRQITLRPAAPEDCQAMYAWRNHPETRHYAFDSREIDWPTHLAWYEKVLSDPDRMLLIAVEQGREIGVLRYDIDSPRALVSIYLVPGMAGQGRGKQILMQGERWLCRQRRDVRVVEAEIHADNSASKAVFYAAGFVAKRTQWVKELHGEF